MPLNVSGAFHSPLMQPARDGLAAVLADVAFAPSTFPVISNVLAQPVPGPMRARDLLVEQLTAPVRWWASVGCMLEMGAGRFVELGPGSVLTGLSRRIAKRVPARALGDVESIEAFLREGASVEKEDG